MAKTVYGKFCWTVVLVSVGTAFGQMDQNTVRLELKDRSRNGPPETLPVYVEVATVQPNVEQGIVFTLNIENNSAQTVRIMDPIDRMGIVLTGFTRPFTKNLRNTRPDSSTCKIRSFSTEQIKTIFADKRAKRPFQAYDVDEALLNRRQKTVSDIMLWEPPPHPTGKAPLKTKSLSESERFDARVGGKLTLEPGERFQAVLQITKVYADYQGYKKADKAWRDDYLTPGPGGIGAIASGAPPSPKPEIIPIPSDKYYLSVSMSFFADIAGTCAPSFEKSVIIQLGEPTSPDQSDTVVP